MIVSSDEIDGENAAPFVGVAIGAGDWESYSLRGVIIEGSIAVTMVELAAPPIPKSILANSSWGNTLWAWTNSTNASAIMV